jgi:phytanoyl-CoA hydroxylase
VFTTDLRSRYFLEEDAVDAEGNLTREKQKAVNKIGHGEVHSLRTIPLIRFWPALHELDPIFRKVTLENENLRKLVRDLKYHHDPVGESY